MPDTHARFHDATAAEEHAAALHESVERFLIQPYDERVESGETALQYSSAASSRRSRSKGPILPPQGQLPQFDGSGTYAEEDPTPADPDFEMWDVGYAALKAACLHLEIPTADLLYARVDLDRRDPDKSLLMNWNGRTVLGWRQLAAEARSERERNFRGLRRVSSGKRLGLGPRRIDAHSAAVAAVHAAAPANAGHQTRRHTGEGAPIPRRPEPPPIRSGPPGAA